MIDGRFDQHFLEIFARSPARQTEDDQVSHVLAVSVILVAVILAGWVSRKPGTDKAIRAAHWHVESNHPGF